MAKEEKIIETRCFMFFYLNFFLPLCKLTYSVESAKEASTDCCVFFFFFSSLRCDFSFNIFFYLSLCVCAKTPSICIPTFQQTIRNELAILMIALDMIWLVRYFACSLLMLSINGMHLNVHKFHSNIFG